jgi:glycosyltransferase involved in cell wall biosynthesis
MTNCCCNPSCALTVTSTEAGFCPESSGPDDFGVWTSGYSIGVPTPTIALTNGSGTSVTNGSSQETGTYTAVSTVPTSFCAGVPDPSGGGSSDACITYAGPASTAITHTCPSDPSHVVAAPAFEGWQVVVASSSIGVSNDAGCGAMTGPSGSGTTSDGQTFAIPGIATLNSVGASLTITGTYTLTGSMCCNSDGPGTSLFTDSYTIIGTFSFPFCQGPCQRMSFSVGCYQPTIEEGGEVYVTGSVINSYCTPSGSTVTGTTSFGDLGDPPYESGAGTDSVRLSMLTPFADLTAKTSGPSKIRVGFVAPCLVHGGAEVWQSTLARSLDSRFEVVGVAIVGNIIDDAVVALHQEICPVSQGLDAVRTLAKHSDILITWGQRGYAAAWRHDAVKPILVSVSHLPPGPGYFGYASGSNDYADTRDIDDLVAVSPSALLSIPEPLRSSSTVIPNAVDPARLVPTRSRAEVRKSWNVAEDAVVVGYLGRLAPEKNPAVMIDLARLLLAHGLDWQVVIVGDGVLMESLRWDAPPNVHLVGSDPRAGDVLAAFDTLVVPSHYESYGLAIVEALSVGIPVVSTNVGVAREFPGLTEVVASGRASAFLDALTVDYHDAAGTLASVESGKAWVSEIASVEVFGKRWSAHLAGLLPPKAVKPPGLLKMGASLVKAVVAHVADAGRKASAEVQAERKAACFACPLLDKVRDRCLKCGCTAMNTKRSWASSVCPDDPPRWESVDPDAPPDAFASAFDGSNETAW